ncbi:MAG: hypothetical protein E6Q97_23835 [Desulfurellales bacterium]|nr:MAG: hypothetical protein E6Q97_23835 [Desulfurellales bacterium]
MNSQTRQELSDSEEPPPQKKKPGCDGMVYECNCGLRGSKSELLLRRDVFWELPDKYFHRHNGYHQLMTKT